MVTNNFRTFNVGNKKPQHALRRVQFFSFGLKDWGGIFLIVPNAFHQVSKCSSKFPICSLKLFPIGLQLYILVILRFKKKWWQKKIRNKNRVEPMRWFIIHLGAPSFFYFWGGWGLGVLLDIVAFSCCSQCVPWDVPNSTTLLSHILCQMFLMLFPWFPSLMLSHMHNKVWLTYFVMHMR